MKVVMPTEERIKEIAKEYNVSARRDGEKLQIRVNLLTGELWTNYAIIGDIRTKPINEEILCNSLDCEKITVPELSEMIKTRANNYLYLDDEDLGEYPGRDFEKEQINLKTENYIALEEAERSLFNAKRKFRGDRDKEDKISEAQKIIRGLMRETADKIKEYQDKIDGRTNN